MGTAPMAPLLFSLAIPMMVSMLVQALYNIVDSIFVSYVDEAALSAVSLAFPVQNLMIAFAVGTGIGVNAHLSRSLGEGNQAEANRAAANGLFLSVCSYLVFLLFGLFAVRPFLTVQTTDAAIFGYGLDYMTIVCVFSLGIFIQCMLEKILTATGRSSLAMLVQLVGALTNLALDPIFIFGLFGLPKMGAAGAALATVCGQTVGAVFALFLNKKFNTDVHLGIRGFKPDPRTIRRIYAVGVPSIAMNAIGSVMTFGMNAILIRFSSTAVAVFGVYFKLNSFIFMPIFGLNNGMVPIISYNYGARKPARILSVIRLAMFTATGIMVVGLLAAQIWPDALLGIFNAGPEMLSIGEMALRIISIHFVLAGVDIILSSTFQALGQAGLSLIISLVRQLIVLLPVAFLLSFTGDVNMIWWCFPIAEVFAFVLSIFFAGRCRRDILLPLEAEAALGSH